MDHHSSSGRRERSDSADYNNAQSSTSSSYMTDPRNFDPSSSYNNDAMYQPTGYDPQYNQADYWQVQAQQWQAMQAANGDSVLKNSTAAPVPLPIPPHLQNHHSHGSTPPPTSTSRQQTPHQVDSHTPPLNRTDSPLLDNEVRDNKVGEVVEEKPCVNTRDKSVEKDDTNTGGAKSLDHSVDLDTRLKMLMKDKSSVVPAFLFESLQSDEDEEVEEEVETTTINVNQNSLNMYSPSGAVVEELKPLSRAPSPFLSQNHYLDCHAERVKCEQVKREKEMSKLQKRHQGGRSRGRRGRPDSRNSDAMSLSSLSSGENNILEEGPLLEGHPHPSYYYGYPSYPAGGLHPPDGSGYYQHSAVAPGAYPMYPGVPGHAYDAANMPPPHLMGGPQYAGMPHSQYGSTGADWSYNWGGNVMGTGYPTDDPMSIYQAGKSDKKSIRPLVR